MTTTTTNAKPTLLGRMIRERLSQLGVTRRQFCLTNSISRQTLYEIEHLGKTNLLASTLNAIDKGCHWPAGTALRYALGDKKAGEQRTANERVHEYMHRIIYQMTLMTVDELERESIWLEEELFGRNSSDMAESAKLIREALQRLLPEITARNDESTDGQMGPKQHTQANQPAAKGTGKGKAGT